MALSGSLAVLTFPDLLHWIGATAISGDLRVMNGDEEITFSFQNGRLHSLKSSREDSRFGERLVRDGILSPELLQGMLGRGPLGKRLVDEAFLSELEVGQLLRRHALETSVPVLKWKDGRFEFSTDPDVPAPGVSIPLSAEEMLLESHRRLDEGKRDDDVA